jgi:sortase A
MQTRQTPAAGGHGTVLLKWIGYLLVIGGGAALGWCAAILTDAYLAQRLARQQLESMPRATIVSLAPAPAMRRMVKTGTPLGELSIPRLGVSAAVLQGSDEGTLRVGLGHIETTSLPGESGNVAIAGHRDSFFRPLRNVQIGDDILLDTPSGRVHYRVSSFRVVDPSEVSVIHPTSEAVLTLVTCFPFYFVGSAPDRFIVRANVVEDQPLSPVQPPGSAVQGAGNPLPTQ